MKTNYDLFVAIARKLGGERSACIFTTLQQFEYSDIFAATIPEDEFTCRLRHADQAPAAAFRLLFEPIRKRTNSWSVGRN
jgi:hypothetical protein